jgi:hypothetical protein
MDEVITFVQSAFKHHVTAEAIRNAFNKPIYDHPLPAYEEKHLLLGWDANANLLEILYNVIEPGKIRVFHARPCRDPWRYRNKQ